MTDLRVCGITAEYNPFHAGHAYHLQQVRAAGAQIVVVAMSGMMVQRGGLAMWRKHARAQMALSCGADIIFELPAPYSCSAAQTFARAGVALLAAAGVDTISFGSECGDLDRLRSVARLSGTPAYDDAVRTLLESGVSYPAAAARAAAGLLGDKPLTTPNDGLGVEYMRAAMSLGASVDFHTVTRQGAEHDAAHTRDGFASASLLRARIARGGLAAVRPYVPEPVWHMLRDEIHAGCAVTNSADYNLLALHTLRRMDEAALAALPDVSEGLESRLATAAHSAATLDEFFAAAKTKRYTMARLRRIAGYALLGAEKPDIAGTPPVLRLLGFSERGRAWLSDIKARSPLPMLSSLADIEKLSPRAARTATLESRAHDLFSMCQKDKRGAGGDYRNLVIIT